MSDDKVRLVEHQDEMKFSHLSKLQDFEGDTSEIAIYNKHDDDGALISEYMMTKEKWEIALKPQVIYVTVTSVVSAPELESDEAVRVDVVDENRDGAGANG